MKKQFAVFATIVFAGVSLVQAQDASQQNTSGIPESPGQESIQPGEGIEIEEPSGAPPEAELPAPPPTPPGFDARPVDPTTGAPGLSESDTNATTITVSKTFTNAQNAITIVGRVNSEEEKQKVEQALQEALPDKEINNHLTVAGKQITEPSGAEKPQDETELEDEEDAINEEEIEVDPEREFELDQQGDTQALP